MAKKTRKQKQRAAIQRTAQRPTAAPAPLPAATAPTTEILAAVAADDAPSMAPAAGAASVAVDLTTPDPGRRRVERVSPAAAPVRPRAARTQASGYIQPLESEDAAIPFDRVPYVPADLRRVAIIAGLMIALIIVADIIVSNVVK